MIEVKREISKELYDKLTNSTSRSEQRVLVSDYLGASIVHGYGLYGFSFSEDSDGRCYLIYEKGDTCD